MEGWNPGGKLVANSEIWFYKKGGQQKIGDPVKRGGMSGFLQCLECMILKPVAFTLSAHLVKGDSKSETIFDNWKPFKYEKKSFLFHLQSFFRSQDL